MKWRWIDIAFPWIGVLVTAVFLVLLFGNDLLRSGQGSSRWRDRVWLSWLAPEITEVVRDRIFVDRIVGRN